MYDFHCRACGKIFRNCRAYVLYYACGVCRSCRACKREVRAQPDVRLGKTRQTLSVVACSHLICGFCRCVCFLVCGGRGASSADDDSFYRYNGVCRSCLRALDIEGNLQSDGNFRGQKRTRYRGILDAAQRFGRNRVVYGGFAVVHDFSDGKSSRCGKHNFVAFGQKI